MSRTTKTRSTRRYYSPSSSPLRDSDRHYFPSSSPFPYLSPVRYKYTYVDTTSHRPGYASEKVGRRGKGEEYHTSSSSPSHSPSPSPRLRRNRSVSILRSGSRPRYNQGYGQGYGRGDIQEDSQEPKKEMKTSISYTSPRTPRSCVSRIQYRYTSAPYYTLNHGSGGDCYDSTRGRSRSRGRSREGRVRRSCVECLGCGDGDRDERCKECSRSTYRTPARSLSPSPTTSTTRVHIKNINNIGIENRKNNHNPRHNSKKEIDVRVSVDRKAENKCEEGEGGCGKEERGKERGRERGGWRSIRNRTPTPYYEGFVRCRCRDWNGNGLECGCKKAENGGERGERDVKSCERNRGMERGRKRVLEYNYISPISIPIRDAASRSRLSERGRGRERDRKRDKTIWKHSDMHTETMYHPRGVERSQNFRTRNRNLKRSRSRSKSREGERERGKERKNTKERIRYIMRSISVPRDGSLSQSRSRSIDMYRDKDRSASKRRTIYYIPHAPHVSHASRDNRGRAKSESRGRHKRRDISPNLSTCTSISDYTSEEIEREVRIKRKYSINGGSRGEARDQGKGGGREARGERESGEGEARGKGGGVRFTI